MNLSCCIVTNLTHKGVTWLRRG